MNRIYKTSDLYSANLLSIDSYNSYGGIKNIIGIKVEYKEENLFYSILDDCFFRIFPQYDFENGWRDFEGRLFVNIFEYQEQPMEFKTIGMDLQKKIQKESITKPELIASKKLLRGYFSDLDYDLPESEIDIDFKNVKAVEENVINTVQQYEERLERPITYDSDHIYGPNRKKSLR